MRIPKQLADDLRWLAEVEQWTAEDKEEAKRCLRLDYSYMSHFFTVWVQAKRHGYKFQAKGRYVKLAEFCSENGLPDPYAGQFTDQEVDE